jgi:hypothetical protein
VDNFETRRVYYISNEKPKLAGKLPRRIELIIARAYMRGDLEVPLEEVEDMEFDRIRGVGPGTLAEIRKVINFKENN